MTRRSSAVEQSTVNQLPVGSIPTAGARIEPVYFRLSYHNSLRCFVSPLVHLLPLVGAPIKSRL